MLRTLPHFALAFCTAGLASAQLPSFYIDVGNPASVNGTPSNTYAAAAGAPGEWFALDPALSLGGILDSGPLTDTTGGVSGVTLTVDGAGFDMLGFVFNEPNTMGDDAALMDDIGYYSGPGTWTFDGLPAGTYDVITYGMAPDDPTLRTSVDVASSTSGLQDVGGDFSAGFALGVTHALHTVTVTAGSPLVISTDIFTTFDSINGIQIVGDGTGSGFGTNYCMAEVNSTGSIGTITASGSPSAAANNVTLTASNLPANQFGIFVAARNQGFSPMAGGTSNGNICLGGVIGRYNTIQNTGAMGEFSLPIDLTVIPEGGGTFSAMAGDTVNFQAWYRDPVVLGSNFTEGLSIDFN